MASSSDKKTIGLTSKSSETMEHLMARSLFAEQMDAAKFALSLAINAGTKSGATSAETVWSAGGFDEDGELRNILRMLYPETETPVRLMEHLINKGFEIIQERAEENAGNIDIVALMRQRGTEAANPTFRASS